MKWAALIIAGLGVLALLWLASEEHYSACVDRAPITYDIDSTSGGGSFAEEPTFQSFKSVTAKRDTSDCSHIPFL